MTNQTAFMLTRDEAVQLQRENERLRERAEAAEAKAAELRAELDAVRFAAHMPADYAFGLPSWINQELYGKLVMLLDRDGRVIRRSEDIELMHTLRGLLAEFRALFAGAYCISRKDGKLISSAEVAASVKLKQAVDAALKEQGK